MTQERETCSSMTNLSFFILHMNFAKDVSQLTAISIRYHPFNRWLNACHSPEEGCALVDIERLCPNSPLGSICCSAAGNLFSRQSSWKSYFRCKGLPWTNSRGLHPGTYQGGIQNPVNWAQSIKTPRGISAPELPTEFTEAVQACIIA